MSPINCKFLYVYKELKNVEMYKIQITCKNI